MSKCPKRSKWQGQSWSRPCREQSLPESQVRRVVVKRIKTPDLIYIGAKETWRKSSLQVQFCNRSCCSLLWQWRWKQSWQSNPVLSPCLFPSWNIWEQIKPPSGQDEIKLTISIAWAGCGGREDQPTKMIEWFWYSWIFQDLKACALKLGRFRAKLGYIGPLLWCQKTRDPVCHK